MSIWLQQQVEVATRGRGFYNCCSQVSEIVACSGINTGICHLFLQHTSASLILTENADPDVRTDLEAYFSRQVPDGGDHWKHSAEGADDMPAHIRSMWTGNDHSVPIRSGRLALGTWQGVYLWEHRFAAHQRQLLITLNGTHESFVA
ncbi:MAG: YjbQ family protein [Proteobacteria bacterium]|nr:YjbQ family protein [Pseudomonadota bacterium]